MPVRGTNIRHNAAHYTRACNEPGSEHKIEDNSENIDMQENSRLILAHPIRLPVSTNFG